MAALTLLITAPKSMALSVQFVGGSGLGPYQTGSGGEFTLDPDFAITGAYVPGVTKDVASLTGSFQTFCLERNEFISYNGTYTVALNTAAVAGGFSGGSPDPLSVGTAWLYSLFATGGLAGYSYNAGGATAAALQNTIWWLEGELPNASNVYETSLASMPLNIFSTMVTNQFGSVAGAAANATAGQYGVRILNLTTGSFNNQDMLILVPDGGLTVTLLGIALGSLALVSRKIRKS